MRKVLAIVALSSVGFLGVAACTAAVPAVYQPPWPTKLLPLPSMAPADKSSVASYIARIAVGKGGLAALDDGDGQATSVTCDPSTVSNPSDAGTPTSASCRISYSDGSVWKQTVAVTFDSHGHPVADSTDLGTELLSPAGG
jgi:hypothetical protein